MREKWARRIAFLTGLLVLLLAIVFAIIQNPVETPDPAAGGEQATSSKLQEPVVTLDLERIEAGVRVYRQQSCARCHSIAGKGNIRNPLDGVGKRRSVEELRNWTTGEDALQGELPGYAFKLKQTYKNIIADDLEVLVIYMQSLTSEGIKTE